MYLIEISIKNYKSFYDSASIILKKGVNIIVGENNSGKSTFLEALKLTIENNPHRSLISKPQRDSRIDGKSVIIGKVALNKDEIINYINKQGYEQENSITFFEINPGTARQVSQEYFKKQSNYFLSFKIEEAIIQISQFIDTPWDKDLYTNKNLYSLKPIIDNNELELQNSLSGLNKKATLSYNLLNYYRTIIYYFKAERYNIGITNFSEIEVLSNDAQNLPGVLHVLQSKNPVMYAKYTGLVKEIFPFIKTIRSIPVQRNRVEIKIWMVDPSTERDDLAISLNHSGTGIAQVLAMLYVIITSEQPRTIIIDEPQSFLHPGAIRKLMNIFSRYRQHQYIISTHSPVVVNAFENAHLILLELKDNESIIKPLDNREILDIRHMFHSLGVKLSDIFGADNILWVEGETEEECFPHLFHYIFKESENNPLSATQICAVQNTGDFDGKKADLVFDIYAKLSSGNRIFPPAICFIFDKEKKSDTKIADIKRRSKDKAYFLPRRMYENYLLDPEAITVTVNEKIKEVGEEPCIVKATIEKWIEQKKESNTYNKKQDGMNNCEWEATVDAATLLSELFSEITNGKFTFDKKIDSLRITQWLIKHKPDFMKPIVDFLKDIFN